MTFPGRLRLLGRRLLAFLLDWALLLVYLMLLTAVTLIVRVTPLASSVNRVFANPTEAEATIFVVLVLPVLLYFALFEASTSQATPGKRWLGLSVGDQHGNRISVARALVRNALKLVPWELAHASIWRIPGGFAAGLKSGIPLDAQVGLVLVYVVGGVYAVSVLVTPWGQTLYDLFSRTLVKKGTGYRLRLRQLPPPVDCQSKTHPGDVS